MTKVLKYKPNSQLLQAGVSSCVFTCICPSGLEYTKHHVKAMKEWRKIVMNYLKIERIYNKEILRK